MRVGVEETPIELRRRAAQHLESVRYHKLATKIDGASLADEACPIYRPDMDAIAYWEYEVSGLGERVSSGFIVVATGEHDHPVSHWSLDGEPRSRMLEREAEKAGHVVARIVKVDSLCYVAEDQKGSLVGRVGQLPQRIVGMPGSLEEATGVASATAVGPKLEDDGKAEGTESKVEHSGPDARIKLAAWESWEQARGEYADVYRLHLDGLRLQASPAWEVERFASELGEGLLVGQPLSVALLERDAKYELSGEAAGAVKVRPLARREGPGALELSAESSPFDREAEFDLSLSYPSGTEERLKFFLVSNKVPSRVKADRAVADVEQGRGIKP